MIYFFPLDMNTEPVWRCDEYFFFTIAIGRIYKESHEPVNVINYGPQMLCSDWFILGGGIIMHIIKQQKKYILHPISSKRKEGHLYHCTGLTRMYCAVTGSSNTMVHVMSTLVRPVWICWKNNITSMTIICSQDAVNTLL